MALILLFSLTVVFGAVSLSSYRGKKFQNLYSPEMEKPVSPWKIMKKFFTKTDKTKPRNALPVKKLKKEDLKISENDRLKVTWVGHSTTIVEIDGILLMTDPVFEKRASPVSFIGPKRFQNELPIEIEDLPVVDVVLISHNHYDHLDRDTIQKLHTKVHKFLVPLGVDKYLKEWGVPKDKIEVLNWWDETTYKNIKFASTPSLHFSGRGLLDKNETLWTSWVVHGPDHRLFFSGDSGYSPTFKKIGEKYGPFHMTLIENGAYNEKLWGKIHMAPEQSVQAHIDLRGEVFHPIHWGTFDLALHAWQEPIERAIIAAEKNNVKIAVPQPGKITEYGKELPYAHWWKKESKDRKLTIVQTEKIEVIEM